MRFLVALNVHKKKSMLRKEGQKQAMDAPTGTTNSVIHQSLYKFEAWLF